MDEPLNNQPQPAATPPATDPVSSGHVVLTQEQYNSLQQAAGINGQTTGANAIGQTPGVPAATSPAPAAATVKPWYKVNWGLLLVACIMLAFLIPGLSGLALPIIVFAVLAMMGFFKDTNSTSHGAGTKAVIIVFKVIAACLMCIGVGVVALIALFTILMPATGSKGS